MNPSVAAIQGLQRELALASLQMDFSGPDAAPEDELNRAIWHSVRGFDTPYPTRMPWSRMDIQEPSCVPALRKPGVGRLLN